MHQGPRTRKIANGRNPPETNVPTDELAGRLAKCIPEIQG